MPVRLLAEVQMAKPTEVESAPVVDPVADRARVFEGLADGHLDRAFGLAYHLLTDLAEAEDACQDALLAAWRAWPQLRDPARFGPWFDRILVNTCMEHLRRRRRRPTAPLDETLFSPGRDQAGDIIERDAVGRALRALSPEQRVVVVLRYWADLSTDQLAERLDVAPGSVRSRLHYALANLRHALTQQPGGDDR
jgi:RNA polymerase sigma-70 factor, ECF subfamily